MDAPKPVYENLFELVKDKDYFVLTTKVDHCFQKAGFAKERLFYTQGDYGLFQCQTPCKPYTYENEDLVKRMVEKQKDMRIPTGLIPKCPICGKPMTMNLRADDGAEFTGSLYLYQSGESICTGRYSKTIDLYRWGYRRNIAAVIKVKTTDYYFKLREVIGYPHTHQIILVILTNLVDKNG